MSVRVLFCGSRGWQDNGCIEERMALLPSDAVVITGGAKGADARAEGIARQRGLHVATVLPLWNHHGKGAGHKRNGAMLALLQPGDWVEAFWDGESKGTAGTIGRAHALGIPVVVNT